MFCNRCGLQVEEEVRFCKNCGQEIGAPAPVESIVESAATQPSTASAPVAAPLRYAGFWIRAVALMIDGLILGIPFMFVVIVAMFFLGGFGLMMHRNPVDPGVAAAAIVGPLLLGYLFAMFFFVLLEWLYFAGMESSQRQATFGKAAMSLRVTDLEGRRLTFWHATGRFLAKFISGQFTAGIGYLIAGFTEKKQALHDIIAGTLVLRKP